MRDGERTLRKEELKYTPALKSISKGYFQMHVYYKENEEFSIVVKMGFVKTLDFKLYVSVFSAMDSKHSIPTV